MNPLFVGTNGYVAAIDAATGQSLWTAKLPHRAQCTVALLVRGKYVYAGHHGYAYCLDKETGEILWENGLEGMGYHPVILTMSYSQEIQTQAAIVTAADQQSKDAAAA